MKAHGPAVESGVIGILRLACTPSLADIECIFANLNGAIVMKSWCLAGLVVAATLVGGCTNDYIPIIDPKPDTGNITAETSAPKTVDLTMAKAWYWNNEVTVMGSAQRNSLSGDQNIAGFIDVEILDKNNAVLDSTMASLMPNTLSSDHPSQYKISIWTKHPAEDHLKVVFIDQRDESAYLGTSGGSAPGSAGAGQSGNYSRPSGGHGVTGGFNGFSRSGLGSGLSDAANGGVR
jgi:hypothetical protein